MRFLCLYKPGKPERPPTQQEMAEMGKFIGEAMEAGWLIATEGCLPSAAGVRVRLSDGKFTVTDGPFAETKEVLAASLSSRLTRSKRPSSTSSTFSRWREEAKQRFANYTRRRLPPLRRRRSKKHLERSCCGAGGLN
jgi:hypothetical protein